MFRPANRVYEMSGRTKALGCGGVGAMALLVEQVGLAARSSSTASSSAPRLPPPAASPPTTTPASPSGTGTVERFGANHAPKTFLQDSHLAPTGRRRTHGMCDAVAVSCFVTLESPHNKETAELEASAVSLGFNPIGSSLA